MNTPAPGFRYNGLVFKGGDPNDPESWDEERTEQTRLTPPKGFEYNGLVFNGGDPNNPESWLDKTERRNPLAVTNDTVIEVANAAAGGVKAISDFISPGNKVSQAIGDFIKFGEQSQSDAVQAEKLKFQRELADAVDAGAEIGTVLEYIASNPLLSAAQAVGSFAVPGGAIKGAGALAKGLSLTDDAAKLAGRSAAAGTAAGVLTGAAMGGGDAAGNAFELVMQTPNEVLSSQTEFSELVQGGMSVDQAKLELANKAARKASVLPAIVGGAFGALGLEKLVAGGGGYTGSVAARALKGFASEGIQEAFEEGLTTASGQKAASEYNPEIDPYQGVAGAAAMGGALGGVLGGTASSFARTKQEMREFQRQEAESALAGAQTADEMIAAASSLASPPLDTDSILERITSGLEARKIQAADEARLEMGETVASPTKPLVDLDRLLEDGEKLVDTASYDMANAMGISRIRSEEDPRFEFFPVPSTTTEGAFNIARRRVEVEEQTQQEVAPIKTPFAQPSVDPVEVSTRLETAAQQGVGAAVNLDPVSSQLQAAAEQSVRRLPDPVNQKLGQIQQAIEQRGGVATEIEADFLARYGAGKPYDRIATNEELGVQVPAKRQQLQSDVINVVQSSARPPADPVQVRAQKIVSAIQDRGGQATDQELEFLSRYKTFERYGIRAPATQAALSSDAASRAQLVTQNPDFVSQTPQANDLKVFQPESETLAEPGVEMPQVQAASQQPVIEQPNIQGDTTAFARATPTGETNGQFDIAMPNSERVIAVNGTVQNLTKGWANKPEVIVADSMRDEKIPMEVRIYDVQQKMRGATGDPRGFFHRGKVYLISSDINSEKDVAEVLFHEALGHYGLRGVFGDSLNIVLDEVTLARPSMVADKARQYGLDVKKPNERRIAAEEVLAELAQTKPELGFVKRAVAAIRAWLRANVPGFKDLAVSDSEIVRNYILPARGWVENAESSAEPDMAPAFSRSAMKDIDANIRRGQEALAKALTEKTSVNRAMFRNGLGWVDFVWGSEGKVRPNGKTKGAMGIAHIFEARARKDGMSEPETISLLDRMVKTIAAGEEIYRKAEDRSQMVSIRMNGSTVWLAKADGSNAWTVTAYDDKGGGGTQVRNGPDIDTLLPTQSNPTLPRARLGAGSLASDATPPSLTGAIRRDSTERGSPTGAESNSNITDDNNLVNKGDLTSELSIKSLATKNATENNQTVLLNVQNDGEGSKFPRAGNESQVDNDEPLFSRNDDRVEGFKTPSESKLDNIIYKLQDKNVDLKRVTQAIKEKVGELDDVVNAYQKEELYHGRAAKQSQDFLNKQLKPLLEDMRVRKVALVDFETYLWNRHAQERNEQVAKVNPELQDGGSGIKTVDAQKYLASLTPKDKANYEALAKRVDRITRDTLQMTLDGRIESKETNDKIKNTFQFYVPLQREESSSFSGSGTGFSVKGSSFKRAIGSERAAVNILANIADARERTITRIEKARVGRSLMALALENPQDDFWYVFDPKMNKNPSQRAVVANQLESMGLDPELASEMRTQPLEQFISKDNTVLKRVNDSLKQSTNSVAVRIDGEDKFIVFQKDNPRAARMAQAMNNLDAPNLEGFYRLVGMATRWFASVNTQWNPLFGPLNFVRDVQGALLNLSTTKIAGKQASVMAGLLPAARVIWKASRVRRSGGVIDGEWGALYEKFQNLGAQTGYRDLFQTASDRSKDQLDVIADPKPWDKVKDKGGAIFRWLEDYNESLENAVRLSAFKTALDQGLSEQQAASTAKNLTVNFNRKGQLGTQIGAAYMFFNSAQQGNARLMETLKGPAGKKIIAGGILAGAAQTMLLAAYGFDEDEPEEYKRQRSFILPQSDGTYYEIPMPFGFHILPNLGRMMTEQLMGRTQNGAIESAVDLAMVVFNSFNPLGTSTPLQTFLPTVSDPFVALMENKDGLGRTIGREDFNKNEPTPGYTRAKNNTLPVFTDAAEVINLALGGTKYSASKYWSPTPEALEYLVAQVTGGVGREASKLLQLGGSIATGEELPTEKIPMAGRLYGDTNSQAAQSSQFYDNLGLMHKHGLEIKGRASDGVEYSSYLQENPEARMFMAADEFEKRVRKLRKRKSALIEKDANPETIRLIDTAITKNMERFNAMVREKRATNRSD